MEMQGGGQLAVSLGWLFFLVVTAAMVVQSASGEEHVVGGNKANGWRTEYNYTEWSSKERFYVGDWLYFGFERSKRPLYSVLQVNKTSYETCIAEVPIKNSTGGAGRDVFQLTEPITYYFISGGGFCFHGMRVAVLTESLPPVQPPSHAKNVSPLDSGTKNASISYSGSDIVILPIAFLTFIISYLFNFW